MPFFTYHCSGCDSVFETLVRGDEVPACPQCGGEKLEKQVSSAAAIHGKLKAAMSAGRAAAAREGHFSNYSKSELKGKL